MIDLKNTYHNPKKQAINLMRQGRLSAYIAQLTRINDLELQMNNFADSPR